MREEILKKLAEIEKSENITILLAVEAGSRSWGHSNRNSDYDVRFIYKHNDVSQYLVLDKFKDVYTLSEGKFDFVGIDIKKALHQHFKSNANLKDWLTSPIVYIPDEIGIFRDLPEFNRDTLRNQYFGMAFKTYKKYIEGNDLRDVKVVKKTLYVIRCNLAWMGLNENPADQKVLPEDVSNGIARMREAYSNLTIDEVDDGELELVHSWIRESFDGFEKTKFKDAKRGIDVYNKRFQEIIGVL